MGGSQSKQHKVIMTIISDHKFQNPKAISQHEFCSQIFKKLNKNLQHSQATPMVSDTHVLKSFYTYLTTKKYGELSKDMLEEKINKIYKRPEKAIQYSYNMIMDSDRNQGIIYKKVFVNYIKKCYDTGISNIWTRKINQQTDNNQARLKKSIKNWLNKNDENVMNAIIEMFNDNSQSSKQFWSFGDFKRWILAKENWFIYVEMNDQIHKIPLHLPCIFGIENFQIS